MVWNLKKVCSSCGINGQLFHHWAEVATGDLCHNCPLITWYCPDFCVVSFSYLIILQVKLLWSRLATSTNADDVRASHIKGLLYIAAGRVDQATGWKRSRTYKPHRWTGWSKYAYCFLINVWERFSIQLVWFNCIIRLMGPVTQDTEEILWYVLKNGVGEQPMLMSG